jgi:hypothetical protein
MILFTSVGLSSSNLFASNGLKNAIPHNYLIIEANYTKRLCPFLFQEVVSSRELSHVCLLRLKVMYFENFTSSRKRRLLEKCFLNKRLLYWIAKILITLLAHFVGNLGICLLIMDDVYRPHTLYHFKT